MEVLAALLGLIAVVILIAFWYGLIPYLLMLLANSLFNEDFSFWQVVLIWWLIMFITNRLGGNKSGN